MVGRSRPNEFKTASPLASVCMNSLSLVRQMSGVVDVVQAGRAGRRMSGFRYFKSCFVDERCIDFAPALGDNVDKRTIVRLSNVNKRAIKRCRMLSQQQP